MREASKKISLVNRVYGVLIWLIYMGNAIAIFLRPFLKYSVGVTLISFAVSALVVLVLKFIVQTIQNKIFSNLVDRFCMQLDPNELSETENVNHVNFPVWITVYGKLYTGKYKVTVECCNCALNHCKKSASRMFWLSFLLHAYFQLDDIELLKDTCDKIDSLVKDNPRYAAEFKTDFYRFYINGQYDKCIENRQNRLAEIEGKSEEYNFARLNIYFCMAVSHFKSKDVENAKKWFEEVIRLGPKMYVSEIAKQYLEKIETGDLSAIELPKVIPAAHYTRPIGQIFLRIITFVAVVLFSTCMVLLAINVFCHAIDLRSELDEIYGDYELLGSCNAMYDGEVVDTFALVLVEDRIDLATLVYYDYGTDAYTKGIEIRIIDMLADREYALTDIFDYAYITELSLIDSDEADDEEYLEKIEFEIDGKDMAFVIKDVYPVN